MTTPWEQWKAKNLAAQAAGKVTPMALLNPDTPEVDEEVRTTRLAFCEKCPSLLISKQCKECGCFMPIKAGLFHATCPLGKW